MRAGELVAIPTETVYGLAANGLNTDAVLKIFEAKNRPLFDPLILHVATMGDVKKYCTDIPDIAQEIAGFLWPGPLTMLLNRNEKVPDLITAGLPQVAIRVPYHPLTLELLSSLDFPLAAPSANPFGYISPTTAQHVQAQLGDKISYILDGGACEVGVESTIIGFEKDIIVVYRLGGLAVEDLYQYSKKVELRINTSSDPKAPGQLKSHYAPRKPMLLGDVEELLKLQKGKKTAVLSFTTIYNQHTKALSPTGDVKEAAHNLFAYMRELDESDADLIIAERFPDTFLGRAINDRLERAAAR